MISTEEVRNLTSGRGNVIGSDGTKIGSIGQIYLDDQTSQPEWVTTKTGVFGGAETFVPLASASVSGNDVRVPFTKDKVKDAPRVNDSEGHLSQDEEAELYRYYGMDYSEQASDSGLTTGDVEGTVGHDTSGPTTDNAMTLSEEQLRVGTQNREAGRARLRKYVDTETVTETVPVRTERAVLEREPITDGNIGNATSGPTISEEEHEVVLHKEVPVVEKTATPVERIRLDKEVEVEQHRVTEEVREERVELDGDIDDNRR